MSNIFKIYDEHNNEKKIPKEITFKFLGKNSLVKIFNPSKISKLNLIIGENSNIIINKNIKIHSSLLIDCSANNASITIGMNARFGTTQIQLRDEPNVSLTIGDDFLCGYGVSIRNGDGHTIYDIRTKKPINIANNIIIGRHVWVCRDVQILKNTYIPSNCIIGMGSIVTKKFDEENCIIAGRPAKIVKRGVNWDPRNPNIYIQEQHITN